MPQRRCGRKAPEIPSRCPRIGDVSEVSDFPLSIPFSSFYPFFLFLPS
jgi:hypothetical protein